VGNRVAVNSLFTLFNLVSNYDLIVQKHWILFNLHILDYSINTLYILQGGWDALSNLTKLLIPLVSIIGSAFQ
jgi:hypothetical protein